MSVRTCIEQGCCEEAWSLGLCLEHFLESAEVKRANQLRFWRQINATTYRGVHDALRSHLGPASRYPCKGCPKRAQDWSYDGHSPDEQRSPDGPFSRDPSFYSARCRKCHKRYDVALRATATHCRSGHPFEKDNAYVRPSQPDTRRCRACERRIHVTRYRAAVGYNEGQGR